VGAVLRELKPLLHLDCPTITGQTLGERLGQASEFVDRSIIHPFDKPVESMGGLVALFGSLAPQGAILKRSAADQRLFEQKGRAVVFTSLEDLSNRIDDPGLEVTENDFLVLQNAGPRSGTGMPESGYLPIPSKLSKAGVQDMVRISDARMSGTAFGTVVLHVTPEAATGGPLGLVRNGDEIELSVKNRRLELLVPDETLSRRRTEAVNVSASQSIDASRGYAKLYMEHVLQADEGCDFDFLKSP
jgi:dihydroxy-acid dehydratase